MYQSTLDRIERKIRGEINPFERDLKDFGSRLQQHNRGCDHEPGLPFCLVPDPGLTGAKDAIYLVRLRRFWALK